MERQTNLMLQTLISLILFGFVANQVCNDQNYTLVSEPRRSTQSTFDDTVDIALCDTWITEDTWIRFSSYSGISIVERAIGDSVPEGQCGTDAPIYIRGLNSHPVNDYQKTNATVCANYGGDTCNWMDRIQIYRCPAQGNSSHYYLYKLKPPPGCSIAYCVGDEFVCPRGLNWNGFSCVDYFPAMRGFPIFSGPSVKGINLTAEVFFSCEVLYDRQPNDTNARFRVTFLFDGQPLEYIGLNEYRPPERLQPTVLNPDISLVAELSEVHLRGRLGREISCQVQSFWEGSNDANSSMTSVATFYAAFESTVDSYSVNLKNGSTFNVTFRSTLPFTCRHCTKNESCCFYLFRLSDITAASKECYLYWKGGDQAVVTVYFVPGATKVKDSFGLVFSKYQDDEVWQGGKSLWRDYAIPPVLMTIAIDPESPPYKKCQSISDPHVTTFDGVYYNNLRLGDFYLTKVINAKQHMEIQVRHELCNRPDITCNCGIIVREGNSAWKISICEEGAWSWNNQRYPTVVRLLSQNPADASTIYIDGTGLHYSVRMPSGLRVEVDVSKPWFNVEVFLPPEYYRRTDSNSMCGNSDGAKSNDETIDLEKFRIPKNSNYFLRPGPNCSSVFNVAATRCGCNSTLVPRCSNNDPNLELISVTDEPFSGRLSSGLVCPQTRFAARVSSSLYDESNSDSDFILDDDTLYPPYTYDPNVGVNVSFTWPTPKNKTEQEVTTYCSDMLQSSPAYADCSANVDIATIIAMCASDIQIADDWISVSGYAHVFEQGCLNNLAASINSSEAGSSNATFEALTSVSGKLCPNKCSGQGTCSDGSCTCNTGFIGADCSIDQSQPPALTGIIRKGVCDVRKRPCDVISVYGSGVAFSSALKCHFTDKNAVDQGKTNGTFITAGEFSCPVPQTTTHRRRRSLTTKTTALSTRKVSITVDGVLYSNAIDFVLFDSVCMECNSSDTCRQKSDSCLISEECFGNGAVNQDNSDSTCLQCVPSTSGNSWTDTTVVESWKPCTRTCDAGVATRNTICGSRVTAEEVQFCEVQSCPDNDEQKSEGFGITLSSDDLKKILREPVRSLEPFSDAINRYCSRNAAACCRNIGIPSGASTVTYTSSDLLSYASGYPIINTGDTSLKVIVKIDRQKLSAECTEKQAQGSNIVYADQKLIYDAVNSEKSEIEKALSITITSVWSVTPKSSSPRTSSSVSAIYSLIGFWVFVNLVRNNFA